MPAAREFEITYGAFVIGGSTATGMARLIDKQIEFGQSFTRAWVRFQFIVQNQTLANFNNECLAVEAAFRIPNGEFLVTLGGVTWISLSHTNSTGFDAKPEVEKREALGTTGRSRRYTVRIDFEKPADNAGTSGRRDSSVAVDYEPSRKRNVTISGTWTAGGGGDARTYYMAQIDAFCNAAISALGGTYKLAAEPRAEHNWTGKLLQFSRVYEEILYDVGATDANVLKAECTISRHLVAPGDTRGAQRLARASVTWSCWINKAITDLKGEWNTLKPALLDKVRTDLGASSLALIEESPRLDPVHNRIEATLEVEASTGGNLLESSVTTEDFWDTGKVLVPAWKDDPDNLAKYEFSGPAKYVVTVTRAQLYLGKSPQSDTDGVDVPAGYVLRSLKVARKQETRGLPGNQIDLEWFTQVYVYEESHPITGSDTTRPNTATRAGIHTAGFVDVPAGATSGVGGGSAVNR
jgi:hypothetical protein